jgi:hypothetical protein
MRVFRRIALTAVVALGTVAAGGAADGRQTDSVSGGIGVQQVRFPWRRYSVPYAEPYYYYYRPYGYPYYTYRPWGNYYYYYGPPVYRYYW